MWASLIFCSLHEIQFWRIVARPPNHFQRTLPFQLESCINHKLKHSHKKWLCHRKWLILFSLKFQRSNQQSALTVDSANRKGCVIENGWCFISWNSKEIPNKIPNHGAHRRKNRKKHIFSVYWWNKKTTTYYDKTIGKLEKKAVCSPCCGDETTTCYDSA